MGKQIQFDYYYGIEAEQFSFYRVPRLLIKDERFKGDVYKRQVQYENRNTYALLKIHPDEMPVSLQLFGSEPDTISEVAKRLEELPFSILDINMGCPVPKIVKNGEGSALMLQPKLVEEIVTKTVKAIRKPVTVKIRKGFDDEHINAVEIAKIVEASGGAAVSVHGRTREPVSYTHLDVYKRQRLD